MSDKKKRRKRDVLGCVRTAFQGLRKTFLSLGCFDQSRLDKICPLADCAYLVLADVIALVAALTQ